MFFLNLKASKTLKHKKIILCEKESVANSKNRKPSEQQCIEYNVADQNNLKKQYLLDKLLLDKSGTYLCHIFSAIQLGIGAVR